MYRVPHRTLCPLLPVILLLAPRGTAADGPLRVCCTTSHLGCVVEAVGGRHVEGTTIIPFGMCPGHFDLTPRQAGALTKADMILTHGFERFLDGVRAAHPELRTVRVGVRGNWMIPETHKAGAEAVAELLCAQRPLLERTFRGNLAAYVHAIDQAVARQSRELAAMAGMPVVCSIMNKDLVESLGLVVLATFPRDEDLSVKDLARISLAARQAGARLVVDNRQSSGKVGRALAAELDVPLAVLTNFPLAGGEAGGFGQALKQNSAALLQACADLRHEQ